MSPDYKTITQKSYDTTAVTYSNLTQKLHPEKKAKQFLSYLKKSSHILDVGCGPGRDAKYFFENGYQITGMDLSQKMVELAKQEVPQGFFTVMDIENLDFPKKSFDGIWASACLLHVPKEKWQNVLKNLHACLKDDGILYISVKKGEGEVLEEDQRYDGVQKFWSFFQEDEVSQQLEKAGFEMLERKTFEKSTSYQTHPWIAVIARKASS